MVRYIKNSLEWIHEQNACFRDDIYLYNNSIKITLFCTLIIHQGLDLRKHYLVWQNIHL